MANFEYDNLIRNWHIKAEEDYFARFSFEFLSFIAFVKNHVISKDEILTATAKTDERSITDRDYIQALKQSNTLKESWINILNNDHHLQENIGELINELERVNLFSERDWWDCFSFDSQNKLGNHRDNGLIRGHLDFTNLVEVWYVVRNTLFHGNKNPERSRDKILVEYCYKTLSVFMSKVALPFMDKSRLYPAIWEDFFERFLDGNAEVNTKYDSSGTTANVYEVVLLDDSKFPFFIGNKVITKDLLVGEIGTRLANLTDDNYKEKIWRLKNAAHDKAKKEKLDKYFGEVIKSLESLWGKLE